MKKEKYSTDFINNASRLDALLTNDGLFTKYSLKIVEDNDEPAVREICNLLSSLLDENISMQVRQVALVYKDDLIKFMGHKAVLSICQDHESGEETSPVSFDELLTQLDALIGLDEVKKTVSSLIAYHRIQKDRESIGLSSPKGTMHMAFLGNPGTGKTTVARIVGRLYRHLGLLSKGHFIEVSRTDLIAGYQGQTALKVKKIIDKAKGGVLFIDEAYSITENEHSDSYGRECLTELTKALEDYRKDLVVIVSGYKEPMNIFFESNPGLKSRFNTFINFPDYTKSELLLILNNIAKESDYVFSEKALAVVENRISQEIESHDGYFPNARLVRNIFEEAIMNQARRLYSQTSYLSKEQLITILEDDVC